MKHLAIFLALSAVFLAGPVDAAVVRVPQDYGTIAQAVNAAPDGSTILVSDGTYGYFAALNLKKDLYIKSVNGPGSTVITGNNSGRLLQIENGVTGGDPFKNLVIDGFTFANGRGVNGVYSPVTIASSKPVFLNCVFENNASFDKGGAVLIYGASAEPSFFNCIFRNNRSDRVGGAVLVNGNNPTAYFKGCLFENNTTRTSSSTPFNQGGAITFSDGSGKVIDCIFRNNSTTYAGGAIMILTQFTSPADTVEVRGCTFDGNFCEPWPGTAPPPTYPPTEGGAMTAENNVTVTVDGCLFTNNYAMSGGAIVAYRSLLRIQNSVFDSNDATGEDLFGFGGAVGINSSDDSAADYRVATVWIENTLIRNSVAPVGGGIFVQGDVSRGTSSSYRGNLYMNRVTIDNCRATLANNSYGNGGGMFLALANCSVTNLYILDNTAEYVGGGFAMVQNSFFRLRDSYIVGNTAGTTDDDYHVPSPPNPIFVNTEIAYNGGVGTGSESVLEAIPPLSIGNRAYLTYLNMPRSSPSISPRIGNLPNDGGFSAGSVLDAGITGTTTYTLDTQFPDETAVVTLTGNGLTGYGYGGGPVALPATLEAERYDLGGSRLAYHDRTTPNEGGTFRTGEQVDIAPDGGAGGGYYVGWLAAGEFLDFSVRLDAPGTFNINTRVASATGAGQYYVSVDGEMVTGVRDVPNTGGMAVWQEDSVKSIALSAGFHTLRFMVVEPGFNVDSIEVESSKPSLAVSPSSVMRVVKVGNAAVSQRFEVYNDGGSNMTYALSENTPWFSINPASGTSAGERDSITVTFNSTALATGTYNGSITITAPGAVPSSRVVNVKLRVRPQGYVLSDFDNDGASDLGVYYPPGGNWYIFRSSRGFMTDQFGYAGTIPVPGDFDGDQFSDLAVYYPPGGNWYIYGSSNGFYEDQFGYANTYPVNGDFDGDGESDLAVYDPDGGNWYIFGTSTGFYQDQFGFAGTYPVPGDFDGDGKSDLAVYYPQGGNWYIYGSSTGFYQDQFGFAGTYPVSGDFDGDGKSDLAVYYPQGGNWYIYGSSTGFYQDQFGFAGTIPVSGDFDGDGKSDLAVYYPKGGNWYVFRSSDGFYQDQFGFEGTLPLGGSVGAF